MNTRPPMPDTMVCFSGIHWNFLFQRPQHLLTRFAATGMRVLYIESKAQSSEGDFGYEQETVQEGVQVIRPHISPDLPDVEFAARMRSLLKELLGPDGEQNAIFWYYNPASIRYTDHLRPALMVYDCIGEPDYLPGAHQNIRALEHQLLDRADLVFAASNSLMKSRRKQNANCFSFPNSINAEHFAKARSAEIQEPADQLSIPHPRLGYYGILNENLDKKLILQVAQLRPDFQFIFIGPLVHISDQDLPRADNIHYLGIKTYEELPQYLGGWDLGLVPLKEDARTHAILPAKVPEYLAAGVRVLSSPLEDVVNAYGRKGLVQVVSGPEVFVNVANSLLDDTEAEKTSWMRQVDAELSGNSWDKTYEQMAQKIQAAIAGKKPVRKPAKEA